MGDQGPQPPPNDAAAGPVVSAEWVVAAARAAVGEVAPRELAVFDGVAESWLAGDTPGRRSRPPGGAVGSGVEMVLVSELVFPVLSAVLGELLGNAAWERIRPRRKGRHRRSAARAAAGAEVRLSGRQLDQVLAECLRQSAAQGVPPDTAARLADAIRGAVAGTSAAPFTPES